MKEVLCGRTGTGKENCREGVSCREWENTVGSLKAFYKFECSPRGSGFEIETFAVLGLLKFQN